jgi:cytochrome c
MEGATSMIKAFLVTVASAGVITVVSAFRLGVSSEENVAPQENSAPVVKIIAPGHNSTAAPGTQIRFEITVSDREDGESRYDEINTKEVMLRVKYVTDSSALDAARGQIIERDPPGLASMRSSNCFNCHNFDTRSIGPAFTEIRKRYEPTAANMALLEKRVLEGSTGVWGETIMPTHAELSTGQIHHIIEWIMMNASATDVGYYVGTKGSFQVPEFARYKAASLTASYTDHGIDDGRGRLQGQDVVVIGIR